MPDTDTQSLQPVQKSEFMWTRYKIYATIMSKLKRATKQRVDLEKTVAELLYDADIVDAWFGTNGKTSTNLIKQLHSIESAFGIQIYATYTLHDVASVAEWWLEKRGRFAPTDTNIESANAVATKAHQGRSK